MGSIILKLLDPFLLTLIIHNFFFNIILSYTFDSLLYLLKAKYKKIKSANKKIETGQAPKNKKYRAPKKEIIKNIRKKQLM